MNSQDFWRIYRAIYRRRWLALAIFGSCFGVVLLGCLFMPRYYRSSAYVMPSQKALSQPVIPGTGVTVGTTGADTRQQESALVTMIGLARTGEVLQRASTALGLGRTPAELQELVTIEPGQGTLIQVSALSRTSDGAIALANAIAHKFSEYYRDLTSRQATHNREFLTEELGRAKRERDTAKEALQTYKVSQREAALPAGEKENPFLTQFYALRSQQEATQSELNEVEARLGAVQTALRQQSPTKQTQTSTTDNPETKQLQDQLAKLEGELLLAQTRYTEKHRKIKDLKVQIADIRDRLSRELSRMVTHRTVAANPTHDRLADDLVDLTTRRAALTGRLSALSSAMVENEARAGKLADTSVVLLAKTRDYENAQANYERLDAMLAQAKVEAQVSSETGEIQVIDEATSATGPVTKKGPSMWQLALLGLVLAAGLALGTALALEFLDDRIRSRADLLRELELPVPAVIPALVESVDGVPLARITELRPLSAHAEAYRFLRTELLHHDGLARLRTILVATARPAQGGSTTAVNLAISLAEAGKRVVLVDADLRRPVLHTFFGSSNEAGLTTLLSDGAGAVAQSLQRTNMENLLLLPAGPPSENPAALLSSERMRQLIASLREHSDHVVFDAPSAATFSDAAVLASQVEGVVMVVRANQAIREAERRTRELFAKVGANVIGAVLNEAPAQDVDSYFFYQHYYPNPSALPPQASGPELAALSATSSAATAAPAAVAEKPEAAPPVQATGALVPAPAPAAPVARPAPVRPAPRVRRPPEVERGARKPRVQTARRPTRASTSRPLPRWLVRGVIALAVVLVVLAVALGYSQLRSRSGHPASSGKATVAAPATAGSAAVTVTAVVKFPTDVRVERDGKLLYDGPLTAGQQIWQASQEITVWASRPDAIELTVNGKPVGTLGREGDPPTSRRFTAEGRGQ